MDMAEVTDRDMTQLAPHWSTQIDPETGVQVCFSYYNVASYENVFCY